MPHKRAIDLNREECVELLTAAGIQCYDHETKATLIAAIESELKEGTLQDYDLPEEDRPGTLYGRGLGPRPLM